MEQTEIFKYNHKQLQYWLGYGSDEYLNFLLSLLHPKEGELVLDNGCGNGRFSIAIGQKGARVVALDLNLSLLKKTAATSKEEMLSRKIDFVLADMQNLPFRDDTFGKVLCVHNLWCVPHYKIAVKEMLRALKENGRIVIDHLNILNFHVLLAWVQYFTAKIARRSPLPVFYRNPYEIFSPFKSFQTSVFSLVTKRPGHFYAIKGLDPFAARLVIRCSKTARAKN